MRTRSLAVLFGVISFGGTLPLWFTYADGTSESPRFLRRCSPFEANLWDQAGTAETLLLAATAVALVLFVLVPRSRLLAASLCLLSGATALTILDYVVRGVDSINSSDGACVIGTPGSLHPNAWCVVALLGFVGLIALSGRQALGRGAG